jgi:hypothetical protein
MSTPPPTFKATLQADESKVWAWLKAQWPHFVTWLTVAWAVLGKHL